jgi:hypothetical protein
MISDRMTFLRKVIQIRAETATALLNEMKAGNLTALIARSADYLRPTRALDFSTSRCSSTFEIF